MRGASGRYSAPYSSLTCCRAALIAVALVSGCSGASWNSPYPAGAARQNVLYASFKDRPKHLDPVQSYSENEFALIANIYQPPLQYHYLKRPYQLVPFGMDVIGHDWNLLDEVWACDWLSQFTLSEMAWLNGSSGPTQWPEFVARSKERP